MQGRSSLVQLREVGPRRKDCFNNAVAGDEAMVVLRLKQFLQRVHGGERSDVLLVNEHSPYPDRGFRKARSSVTREGVLKYNTLGCKIPNGRSELDSRIVGRK